MPFLGTGDAAAGVVAGVACVVVVAGAVGVQAHLDVESVRGAPTLQGAGIVCRVPGHAGFLLKKIKMTCRRECRGDGVWWDSWERGRLNMIRIKLLDI